MDPVNIQVKGSLVQGVPLDQVAQETMISGLFQERLINNVTCSCSVGEVNWRSFGMLKEKEPGSCIICLLQNDADDQPGGEKRKGSVPDSVSCRDAQSKVVKVRLAATIPRLTCLGLYAPVSFASFIHLACAEIVD